jgi:molybdopterin converting factor small subunit
MVTVRIPTLLRPAVGGAAVVETDGTTVGEVLRSVAAEHTGFGGVVFEKDGSLKRYLAVFLGDQDVRHLRGLDTTVPDGAEIVVIPAASGGSG